MASKNTLQTVTEQILIFNSNVVQLLSGINNLITSDSSLLSFNISDNNDNNNSFTLPSFGYLQSEINRLNNNINSFYNISNSGSLIQTNGSFQKIVTVDLNIEPNDIGTLSIPNYFVSKQNWFFDKLLDPELFLEIDLTNKINSISTFSILSRRYIIQFEIDSTGNYTTNGQSAINSFNSNYRNNNNIKYVDFLNWCSTTPGIINNTNLEYDEQLFNLEPNNLMYDGVFSVLGINEDILSKKLYYILDTLNYLSTSTNQTKQLVVGDILIINTSYSKSKYQILEIVTVNSSPQLVLQRIEGNDPIPVGIGTLKIYSDILYTTKIKIPFGYNNRCVIFLKSLNSNNNILSKNWSLGIGVWTNDLILESSDNYNGYTLDNYYTNVVNDYGMAIKDLTLVKIPSAFGLIPNTVTLNSSDFQVIQTNLNITNSSNLEQIKTKSNQQNTLISEINQISQAIINKNKQLKITKFTTTADQNQFNNELNQLISTKNTKSNLLSSVTQDILNLSNSTSNIEPIYAVNGFWNMPSPLSTINTGSQQVIQFIVSYRKLNMDGTQNPTQTIKLSSTNDIASYSNWKQIKTDTLTRIYDQSTGQYKWILENISNPDVTSINQIQIPISYNEQVEIRVKSVSEAGWPDCPLMSDWSDSVIIPFPSNLNNTSNTLTNIINNSNLQNIQSTILSNLNAQGLNNLLSQIITTNNITYYLSSDVILSGFKDSNSIALSLFDYISKLNTRITNLENIINNVSGLMEISIYKNSNKYQISSGSEVSFNIECEDYLTNYTSPTITSGRIYYNNIYVIKDFYLRVSNLSSNSPLGLSSKRLYNPSTNGDVYNSSAPQVFWVDSQNNILLSNNTGITTTQLDNQFIWSVNYDNVTSNIVSKISDNIGNSFTTNDDNSLVDILSSTEFNIGYSNPSILNFVGMNNSLLETQKWIENNVTLSSTTKLLTTIHPVIDDLSNIVQNNSNNTENINYGVNNDLIIPINIYFKMNSLDQSQSGDNFQFIDLNQSKTTILHTKKIKFYLENVSTSTPFEFTIVFNINRNKVIVNNK